MLTDTKRHKHTHTNKHTPIGEYSIVVVDKQLYLIILNNELYYITILFYFRKIVLVGMVL